MTYNASRHWASYKDPRYDNVEASLEQEMGLPKGGMRAIRTRGERSNANQVSSAEAKTVYQITPPTRALFLRKYKVDAYASPENAARVAALHLRDDMRRTGSWEGAVRNYIGGPDPSKHGKQTNAYVGRVTGYKDIVAPAGSNGAVMLKPGVSARDIPSDVRIRTAPNDMGETRRPLGPEAPRETFENRKKQEAIDALIAGGGSVPTPTFKPDFSDERQGVVDGLASTQKPINPETGAEYTALELLESSWAGRTTTAMIERWSKPEYNVDADWVRNYGKNFAALEEDAISQDEIDERRATRSEADYLYVVNKQKKQRIDNIAIDSSGYGWAWRLQSEITDPVGWAAGLGAGKAFQTAGVGATALARAGKPLAATGSLAAESALGNVAVTALLDANGVQQHGSDYAASVLYGAAIGAMMSPLAIRGQAAEGLADNLWQRYHEEKTSGAVIRKQAEATLGPDANEHQIATEVSRIEFNNYREFLDRSLADVDEGSRLLAPTMLTGDKAVAGRIEQQYGVSTKISDKAEASLAAEHIARAEAIDAANPVDAATPKTVLSKLGMESTGARLVNSDNVVLRAVGKTLLENTTGAAGRRRTAAISQAVRERLYNRHMVEYDDLARLFRDSEGGSIWTDLWDGRHRKDFQRRVFLEIENRGGTPEGTTFDHNPAVTRAADLVERGMNIMRMEMQHVDAVGSARLGTTSRGYIEHRLDAATVVRLSEGNAAQWRGIQKVLERQFMDPENGFIITETNKVTGERTKVTKTMDQDFAKTLSVKYLEHALVRAKGGHDVPANLHSPEAADIVRDALDAMNLGSDAVEDIMGKYSRGGAGFTKKRLRLNLNEDIGDGMVLGDIFNQDVAGLYRSYARRVSGEVALAQYGVMGKKGLAVLREAARASGATAKDLEAFDQIAAEFLNTPFGSWNHKHMDNLRIATSAARLGGMGITQFAEYGNAVSHIGVMRTLDAISSFGRLRKEIGMLKKGGAAKNPILDSIDTLGGHIGLDDYNLTRIFDVKDNDIQMYGSERLGLFSRALRAAGHGQQVISAHRIVTAVQTRGMAEQIIRKAIKFARDGLDDVHLDDMGIDEGLRAALRRNMDQIATFDSKGRLLELDLNKGDLTGTELMGLRDAVERGASQIIQHTYIGETGKWAHNGFLKMLFQFRTFSITAVEKQWGRSVRKQGGGVAGNVKAFATLMGAMSIAAPIHFARVHAKTAGMSRSERDEYIEKNASIGAISRATLNYASASGLLGDVLDVGGSFANSYGGDTGEAFMDTTGIRGKGQRNLVGGVMAPGVGLLQDLYQGVGADGNGGNPEKLFKALPGSNNPAVLPFLNALTAD